MQVAAMNPTYMVRGEIPKEAVDKQREIYSAQLREEAFRHKEIAPGMVIV